MTVGVERPLETVRHIPASSIASVRHGLRSHARARAGSADEEQLAIFGGARRIERTGQTFLKARINLAFRIRLPFHRENPLADPTEIGEPHERPFCTRAHIDQNRTRITAQTRPYLFHRHILDVDDF